MKTKSNFILRKAAQTWVILPLGDEPCDGVLTANDSGALLWQLLEQGCSVQELVNALTKEYDVSAQQAREDVDAFIEKLRRAGCIEEDA